MIGRLRTRVGLYGALETPDDLGGVSTSWPLVTGLWASIRQLSPKQSFENGRAEIRAIYRVTIRHHKNFPERARLIWDERILRVVTASDPDGRRERLHLICEEEQQ